MARLRCKPGNYQCGGVCISNKHKCTVTAKDASGEFTKFAELVKGRIISELKAPRNAGEGKVTDKTIRKWKAEAGGDAEAVIARLDKHIKWWQGDRNIEPPNFEEADALKAKIAPAVRKAKPKAEPLPESKGEAKPFKPISKAEALKTLKASVGNANADVFFDEEAKAFVKYEGDKPFQKITDKEVAITKQAHSLGFGPEVLHNEPGMMATAKAEGKQAADLAPAVASANKATQRKYANHIFSAMQTMHEAGIVHGDLHDENIFVSGAKATFIDYGESNSMGTWAKDVASINNFQGDGTFAETTVPIFMHPPVANLFKKYSGMEFTYGKDANKVSEARKAFYSEIFKAIDSFK